MKVLAIIPARGGSKGVPDKNIRLLRGKPLITYTISAALQSQLLSKVIVSTDSEKIAEIATRWGADVPFIRPDELAQDNTPTLPVLQHALQFLAKHNEYFDAVCLLQPTSPFRPSGFIDDAIRTFTIKDTDALVSVLPVPDEYNPHWAFISDNNGLLSIATGEKQIIPRRQDLPKAYFRDGALYLTKTNVLLKKNSIYGDSLSYIVSDPRHYVNIDTPQDWDKAERLAPILCAE